MVRNREGGEGAENWLDKLKSIVSSFPGEKLNTAAQETIREDMHELEIDREKGPIPVFLYSEGRVLEKDTIRELNEGVILVPLNISREITEPEKPIDITLKKLRAKIQGDLLTIFPKISDTRTLETKSLWETRYIFNHPEDINNKERSVEIIVTIFRKNPNRIAYVIGVIEEPDLDRK